MAISQNFLTGRMRKSAGGTRFSTWKGLNIVAAKPISVRQNVTAAVQLNRDKMSVVGKSVSKMNAFVNLFYNFGIQKTTPFADTVKFFRNRLKSDLTLDPLQLNGSKFGTGNIEGLDYEITATSVSGFSISALAGQESNDLYVDSRSCTVMIINDDLSKIHIETQLISADDTLAIDLSDYGFSVGDKVKVSTKDVKFRPGADLAGKVKFTAGTSFVTLTA